MHFHFLVQQPTQTNSHLLFQIDRRFDSSWSIQMKKDQTYLGNDGETIHGDVSKRYTKKCHVSRRDFDHTCNVPIYVLIWFALRFVSLTQTPTTATTKNRSLNLKWVILLFFFWLANEGNHNQLMGDCLIFSEFNLIWLFLISVGHVNQCTMLPIHFSPINLSTLWLSVVFFFLS